MVRPAWGAAPDESDHLALLSDTHISQNREEMNRGIAMYQNLARVREEVLNWDRQPRAVLISGDCAYLEGKAADYEVLLESLEPYRAAGLPVHLMLGNHDHRERLWEGISWAAPQQPAIEHRHITVLELPQANWFLLDSLIETNFTPGRFGEEQLRWLATALDMRTDKPAVIMAHHQPQADESGYGLQDTGALMKVLEPRRHVKAYFFGHTHRWEQREQAGIHLINLPPVAYTFRQGDPAGWVQCVVGPAGATLRLRSLTPEHPAHDRPVELAWR